jgi:hypothetical protein
LSIASASVRQVMTVSTAPASAAGVSADLPPASTIGFA